MNIFKYGAIPVSLVDFRPFLTPISIIQNEKVLMVCLGFEPGAAGWYQGAMTAAHVMNILLLNKRLEN